ncbi:hypothetical protein HOY82DRAFT_481609 [Tuber indicum]|nr:hypothetical protein HOY82DRAFT_481609 [Tuber indicum]
MIANLVNDLVVLCPNSGFGCPMTCARHLLAGHLREDCDFAAVKCLGCDGTIMRKDAGSGCLHQLVECPFCSFSCRKLDMEGHEAECPRIIAVCSHCSQDFAHPNIKAHEATCGEAIILCDSSDVGCPWKGARRELSEHMRVCAFTPLRPVLHAYADRLATLELENKALRRRLDILIPPRPPTEVPTPSFDEHTIQLLAEQEHLRSDLERLTASLGEMEIRREMLLVNESLGMKEEVAGLRAAIGGIRMQIHWLMNTRHQAVDQRPVGGASSSNGPQNSSSQGGGGALPNITRMAGEFSYRM